MHIALDTANHRAGVVLFAAFLISFGFIRLSTRLMRSPRVPWWPGSIKTESVHVHHMVFGIILLIATGFVGFAVDPPSPWLEICAAGFGIGVGLTVDEFALWLYVEDVSWAKEGRASTDAALICFAIGALVLAGSAPRFDDDGSGWWGIAVLVAEQLVFVVIIVLKGKPRLALLSFFVPFLNWVCAIRLARPNSWWARRFYGKHPKKQARAEVRAQKWDARRDKWLDRIGGAPSTERPTKAAEANDKLLS
jgi:hypothetical protein